MNHLKPLVPYLLGHKPALLFGLLTTVVSTLLALAQPYLIGSAIDALQHGRPAGDVYLIAGEILGLAALQGVFTFFVRYLINRVSRRVEYELRHDLFAHLQRMQQSFFQDVPHRRHHGARHQRPERGARLARPRHHQQRRTTLMFVIAAVLMFGIDTHAGRSSRWSSCRWSASPSSSSGGKMHERYEQVQAQFGNLSTYAQENFSGIRVIKAYAQEDVRDQPLLDGEPRLRAPQHGLPAARPAALADDGAGAGARGGG